MQRSGVASPADARGEYGSFDMGRISTTARTHGAFQVVVIVMGPADGRHAAAIMSGLEPRATAIVVCRADGGRLDLAELGALASSCGFMMMTSRDGAELSPGVVHVPPPHSSVWFEGERLRVDLKNRDASGSMQRLLATLVDSWGGRGVALLAGEAQAADEAQAAGEAQRGDRRELVRIESGGGIGMQLCDEDLLPEETGTFSSMGKLLEAELHRETPRDAGDARPSSRRQRLFPFSASALAAARAACDAAVRHSLDRGRVRVWVPGCKTGALVYATAMLLCEAARDLAAPPKIQIFGTDADEDALAGARVGRYPLQAALGIHPQLRSRYTQDEGANIRVAEALRDLCIFSRHRLTRDAPLSRMDLIVCRRVFDGISAGRRGEVLEALHYALREGGFLIAIDHKGRFPEDRFEATPDGYLRARPPRAKTLPPRILPREPAAADVFMLKDSWPDGEHAADGALGRHALRATERSLAEMVRAHGELESFVYAIGVPLVFCDQELALLHMSAEACSAFGLCERDRGAPLKSLLDRLPGGTELLAGASRAVRAAGTQELTIRSDEHVYLARISAATRGGALGVVIVFTDVTALEAAKAQAVAQRHQQAAVARIGDLALGRASQAELFDAALSVLFDNIPVCCCGIILERVGAGAELAVVASRGFGGDPLATLRSLGEPSHLLEAALAQERPVVHTGPRSTPSAPPPSSESSSEPRSAPFHSALPFVTGGLACPILHEGVVLGTVALYARQSGIEAADHQHFVQAVANILGGAIARHRTRRRLALELEITTILARAQELETVGRGIANAFAATLGADAVQIWAASEQRPRAWSVLFPSSDRALAGTSSWPEGLPATRKPLFRAAAGEEDTNELLLPILGRQGIEAVLRMRGSELRSPDRELSEGLERIGGMLADFLDRLRILDALTRSEASYRQSSAEFEALFATLPVGVSIHDRDGAIRRLNRHLAQLETTRDGAERAPLVRLYSEEAPRWIERVLQSGEPIHDLELSISEGADVQSWLCNFAAIRDSDGTILGASAVVQDITPLKRVEASLREADKQKDDFLAMLGHELRNPMAAIRNATELLSRIDHPSPQLLRLQSIFDRQTVQTTKLIDGLLDIARVVRGKVELQIAPLELCDLVHQIVDDRRHQIRERTIDVFLPEGEMWVAADRVRLTQVLDNLLSNAIKFTSPKGRIEIRVERHERRGSLRIKDDGQGIEPELLPRIFEPFRQGRATMPQSQGGLGLGLALVKGLIELHGFKLDVESEGSGRGTTVFIEFGTTMAPDAPPPESNVDVRHLSLLMVEDNLDIAETLAELLKGAGHTVESVGSAEEALERLQQRAPDIVLCDVGLPGMDGLTLASRLRQSESLKDLKLVAMTGYGDASTRARILNAGFDRHLIKPVQLEALRRCLSRLAAAPHKWAHRH